MKKELRPVDENVTCDVCGRTILKGERTEPFLALGGQRYQVCELCFDRAEHHGWIRESAAGDVPTRVARPEPRRPLLARLRRRRGGGGSPNGEADDRVPPLEQEPSPGGNGHSAVEGDTGRTDAASARPQPRSRPKDPRHVRAVPTNAEVKVERALELFNGSEYQRTIGGLARTLGAPWVTALPDSEQPSAVTVLVAWELSWYRFRIDLGDEADPVVLLEKGEEMDQIEEPLRDWNVTIDTKGQLVAGPTAAEESSER